MKNNKTEYSSVKQVVDMLNKTADSLLRTSPHPPESSVVVVRSSSLDSIEVGLARVESRQKDITEPEDLKVLRDDELKKGQASARDATKVVNLAKQRGASPQEVFKLIDRSEVPELVRRMMTGAVPSTLVSQLGVLAAEQTEKRSFSLDSAVEHRIFAKVVSLDNIGEITITIMADEAKDDLIQRWVGKRVKLRLGESDAHFRLSIAMTDEIQIVLRATATVNFQSNKKASNDLVLNLVRIENYQELTERIKLRLGESANLPF